jgi:hypothetical protein
MASQVDTVAPNDIAELETEFRVMLQATNRSPATVTAYIRGLNLERALPLLLGRVQAEGKGSFVGEEGALLQWRRESQASGPTKILSPMW